MNDKNPVTCDRVMSLSQHPMNEETNEEEDNLEEMFSFRCSSPNTTTSMVTWSSTNKTTCTITPSFSQIQEEADEQDKTRDDSIFDSILLPPSSSSLVQATSHHRQKQQRGNDKQEKGKESKERKDRTNPVVSNFSTRIQNEIESTNWTWNEMDTNDDSSNHMSHYSSDRAKILDHDTKEFLQWLDQSTNRSMLRNTTISHTTSTAAGARTITTSSHAPFLPQPSQMDTSYPIQDFSCQQTREEQGFPLERDLLGAFHVDVKFQEPTAITKEVSEIQDITAHKTRKETWAVERLTSNARRNKTISFVPSKNTTVTRRNNTITLAPSKNTIISCQEDGYWLESEDQIIMRSLNQGCNRNVHPSNVLQEKQESSQQDFVQNDTNCYPAQKLDFAHEGKRNGRMDDETRMMDTIFFSDFDNVGTYTAFNNSYSNENDLYPGDDRQTTPSYSPEDVVNEIQTRRNNPGTGDETENDIRRGFHPSTSPNTASNENESNFQSLSDMLQSSESTLEKHIRPYLLNHSHKGYGSSSQVFVRDVVRPIDRPFLWTKILCSNKSLEDARQSSLADAFLSWESMFDFVRFCEDQLGDESIDNNDALTCDEKREHQDESRIAIESTRLSQPSSSCDRIRPWLSRKILEEATILADRVCEVKNNGGNQGSTYAFEFTASCSKQHAIRNICSLLVFYYQKNGISFDKEAKMMINIESKPEIETGDALIPSVQENDQTHDKHEEREIWNPLMGPIVATLLSAMVPVEVASVMMSTIGPVAMPLLSLTNEERMTVAKELHQHLYLLAFYHVPLLVLHLDRFAPGWFWPLDVQMKRSSHEGVKSVINAVQGGVSWRTTCAYNEEFNGAIPMTWFASLLAGECVDGKPPRTLDTSHLQQYWDEVLTNKDSSFTFFLALVVLEKNSNALLMLRDEELCQELTNVMSFHDAMINDDTDQNLDRAHVNLNDFIRNWFHDAYALRDSTPRTVVSRLRAAEDEAIEKAILLRQEKLRDRLEKEAEARRKALEEERLRKEIEETHRHHLVNFYAKHAPDKVSNVDTVMKVYKDRIPLLDQRLKDKYGVGFLPTSSTSSMVFSLSANKLFSHIGYGNQNSNNDAEMSLVQEPNEKEIDVVSSHHQVAVVIAVNEVIPSIIDKGAVLNPFCNESKDSKQLKYCLVDSRPDDIAVSQGRFSDSVRLSPETLMDPDRIQQKSDEFELLRGDYHICIMGEGISAFPSLYGRVLDNNERQLQYNDESRTSLCALFFIKRGFPYVSILDGGFAAAHAWINRSSSLSAEAILTDYDPKVSLFAELETTYRAQQESTTLVTQDHTTRAMQKLLDRSMIALTLGEQSVSKYFWRKSEKETVESVPKESEDKLPLLFQRKGQDAKKVVNSALVDKGASPDTSKGVDIKKMSLGAFKKFGIYS